MDEYEAKQAGYKNKHKTVPTNSPSNTEQNDDFRAECTKVML